MNIRTRINARKVALSYIYQYCFFGKLLYNKAVINESLFIGNIFNTESSQYTKESEILLKKVQEYYDIGTKEKIVSFASITFDNWSSDDVDFDYLFGVLSNIKKIESDLEKKVNSYTKTFLYKDMDILDKSLFLLGYSERIVLKTPKEIIINELIELAKRYSDEGSPKLINGIMHKILSNT